MSKLLELAHLVHYVYTPLLFLPKWRYRAHSTRLRFKTEIINNEASVVEQHLLPSQEGAGAKTIRFSSIQDREHASVLRSYICDFLRYLESQFGFAHVKIATSSGEGQQSDSSRKVSDFFNSRSNGRRRSSATSKVNLHNIESMYVKKSVPGSGILFCEVGVCEPFVYMKMYAMEASRFMLNRFKEEPSSNGNPTSTSTVEDNLHLAFAEKQLTKEIEEVKKALHMHSFTFDFHLRLIHQLVAGKPTFRKGFNVALFLDDFMMYYNKGPNFARNAIHHGSVKIACTQEWINCNQLYNYVLSHEDTYLFKVLRMEPIFGEATDTHVDLDYALVRHSRCQLSFKFPDQFRNKNTDDVNVTLVVCHDRSKSNPEAAAASGNEELKLNYYIIINRTNEIYPTTYVNTKQSGIFQTVIKPANAEVLEAVNVIFPGTSDEAIKKTNNGAVEEEATASAADEENIQTEAVNYVGYYSTHEQSMQAVMHMQASVTEAELSSVFRKAAVHCRRDQLWKSLHDAECNYANFMELLAFVHTEEIAMSPLLKNRKIYWIKALANQLESQYAKNQRILRSNDGIEHVVFLSDRYVDMALVITLDLLKATADFNVINRFAEVGYTLAAIKSATNEIAEGLYNDVCQHTWTDQFKF